MAGGRRPRVAALVIASLALPACGAASQGAASRSEVPRTGVAAAPGSGAGTATPGPIVTRASADGHVCLGRRTHDAYGFDLPGLDQRPRLGRTEPARLVRCLGDTQRVPGQGEWRCGSSSRPARVPPRWRRRSACRTSRPPGRRASRTAR